MNNVQANRDKYPLFSMLDYKLLF